MLLIQRGIAWALSTEIFVATAITAAIATGVAMPSGAAAISPETYVSRAITLYNRGRYPEAIQLLKRALQINPKYVRAWSWLGFIYVRIGRNQDALAAFKKVIELAPRSEDARIAQQWIAKLQSAKPPPGRPSAPTAQQLAGEVWQECETYTAEICGYWSRGLDGRWHGEWGAVRADLTISISGSYVTVTRRDLTSTLLATYRGTLNVSNTEMRGTVDWCCDGGGNRSGTWWARNVR